MFLETKMESKIIETVTAENLTIGRIIGEWDYHGKFDGMCNILEVRLKQTLERLVYKQTHLLLFGKCFIAKIKQQPGWKFRNTILHIKTSLITGDVIA